MHLARPTTPRIEPVPRVLERLRGEGHDAANLYATLATNKKVSNAMAGVFGCFYGDAADFDDRTREIAILRMAWNVQCAYEYGQHTKLGRTAGMTEEEVVLTSRPLELGSWAPRDLTVLRMVDELYIDDCVTDGTWAQLQEHFTNEQIMALLAVAQMYRMAAGIFNSFGVELDEGIPLWPIDTP
jgi:4-carboxymuconolactone decarboxylase